MPRRAASPPGISSIGCRSGPTATAISCARSCAAAGAEGESAGRSAAGDRGAPSRSARALARAGAGVQGGARCDCRRRRGHRARPARLSRRSRTIRRASARCIGCSSASIIGSRIGAWRRARSTIAASSTSTISPGIRVEDLRTFIAIHPLVVRLIAEDRLHGLRLDHIDGLRDPDAILPAAAAADRGGARRLAPAVLYAGREDPRAKARRCRNFPASPARPATNGSTTFRACWSIRRGIPTLDEPRARCRPAHGAVRGGARASQAARPRHHAVERIHRAGAAAGAHRRRPLAHARLHARPSARGARTLRHAFPGLSHLRRRPTGPSDHDRATIARTIEAARAQWFGPDARFSTSCRTR